MTFARFAFALIAAVLGGAAAFADPPKPYIVRDLAVDVTGPSAVDAQRTAWAQARLTAAERLIKRLTLAEDRTAAKSPLDPGAIARLYTGTQLQSGEKRTATRYISTLILQFDDKAVRDYFDGRGVPFVDTQAGLAMIAPLAAAGVSGPDWAALWKGKSDDTALTPYVVGPRLLDRAVAWSEIQADAAGVGAAHAVIAEASSQNGQIYVRLTDLRAGVPDVALGVAGPFADLLAAQQGAVEAMETRWKQTSVVRTSGSSGMSLVATFKDLGQWVKIRKGIEGSRMISGLKVESISTGGADLTFTYAGRPEQLAADLRARGLDLRGADRGWTLEVASAQ